MKRHCLVLILMAISLFLGGNLSPAFAQTGEPTGLKNVTLWLNPEYDDPRLLVMFLGKITGVEAPARVRFLVPSGAEMYSAGSIDASGKYSGGPPDRKVSAIPGWDEISYELKTDTFRVEYYNTDIVGQPDKTISYDFQALYPVSDIKVIIQEPKKSSNFTVSPEGLTRTDGEGFTVHSYAYNSLIPDSPLHFDIAYTKSDPHPSLVGSADSQESGTTGTSSTNPALLAGIGIIAVAAGIFIFRSQMGKSAQQSRPARRAAARNTARKVKTGSDQCPGCKGPVEETHQFCPQCGRKLLG